MPAVAPTPMALKPAEPSPVEMQQWQQGRGNANQQYEQQVARNAYMSNQATLANNLQRQQMGYNNRQQRQGFDDPYIGRGILNSGIRQQGLQGMYAQQQNEATNLGLDYANQMGQYRLDDQQAMQNRDTTLGNIRLQEQARRTQLRTQLADMIKGIA